MWLGILWFSVFLKGMMAMKVNIFNQTEQSLTQIKTLINHIFKEEKQRLSMQLVFVTNEEIHRLNLLYRHIDKPTDVLSFPNDDAKDRSLGDVFISVDQAKKQAEDYGHSLEREIGFLAVHGYLHLLGYDHHTQEEETLMITKQEEILAKANLERKTT